MSVNVPKNQIIVKYTAGKEFIVKNTQQEYIGYYYEMYNKIFAGKEFDLTVSLELVRTFSPNANLTLSLNSTSSIYNQYINIVNKINDSNIAINVIPIDDDGIVDRVTFEEAQDPNFRFYYITKVNDNSFGIKQVDKDTYDRLQNNPLYKTVALNTKYTNIEQAEQTIPGLKTFLNY